MDRFKSYLLAHSVGLALIFVGWWLTIIVVAVDRFSSREFVTFGTVSGLVIILVGAYLPHVWISIKLKKNEQTK